MAHITEPTRKATADRLGIEARQERLQKLVGELLQKNQRLRFRVSQLERQLEGTERGLADASAWAALLLP